MPSGTKRTREEFIQLSNETHNSMYAYCKVIYVDNLTPVLITCLLHGDFKQLPKCHLRGNGCDKCASIQSANKKILKSKDFFFNEIKKIDPENRWDYSKVEEEYQGTNNNVTLICNGCRNETQRTPYKHLASFQPCRRYCYQIKPMGFVLDDIENVIVEPNQVTPIEETAEEWNPFPESPNYIVSNRGYIQNLKTKRIIKGSLDKISGYMRTVIDKKSYSMHSIVAMAFLPNLENKPTVNHKDKDRTNNCVGNLEWATYQEQNIHKNEHAPSKTYTSHNNGKKVQRIDKETNLVLDTYDTFMLASKWIMENVYHTDTTNKNIDNDLRRISSALSGKIKRNQNNYFGYNNFIWRLTDTDTTDPTEIWEPIVGIEKEGYSVSNFGKIRNPSGKIKETFSIAGGYYDLKIVSNGKHHKIHRLVASHFIDNPKNNPIVNHKNGNKLDNRVENLEWVTNQENIIHAYETGLIAETLSPVVQYDKTGKNIIKEFTSISKASKELNIDSSSISACCRGVIRQTHGYHFQYKQTDGEVDITSKKQRKDDLSS